jgi:uncharacterized protein (TIGR03382 family)
MPTQPGLPESDAENMPLDCFCYRVDPDVVHFVAQVADGARIVASLRLEPMISAPIRTLHSVGATTLPRTDGACAIPEAEDGGSGTAGLAVVTAAAWTVRRRDADEAFWLAGCPNTLLARALALGWRAIPAQHAIHDPNRTTLVLLLDDRAHFVAIGSPLADVAAAPVGEHAMRLEELLEGFDMRQAAVPQRAVDARAGVAVPQRQPSSRASLIARMPAFAQSSSMSPPGAPDTPIAPTRLPADWSIRPPPIIATFGR